MGARRRAENQHQRKRVVPKVILVGSIDATCADQKAVIDFEGDRVVLRIPSFIMAGKMQQVILPYPEVLGRVLHFSGQSVWAKVGSWKEFEVFPKPSWVIKVLSPQLRKIVKA